MRDPLSRDFSSLQASQDFWLHRVYENFRQLLTPARIFPSSANGAPLHLLTFKRTATAGRARTASYRGSQEGGLSFCRTVVSLSSPLPKRTTLGALHWAKRAAAAKMIRDLRDMDSSRRVPPFHSLLRAGS